MKINIHSFGSFHAYKAINAVTTNEKNNIKKFATVNHPFTRCHYLLYDTWLYKPYNHSSRRRYSKGYPQY
jgi:hypothetical protein